MKESQKPQFIKSFNIYNKIVPYHSDDVHAIQLRCLGAFLGLTSKRP